MPIRFRLKPGYGKHYTTTDGKRVVLRAGDEIRCEPEDLGNARDKFEQLEPMPPPAQPKIGLKAVHRGGGRYDVINEATGTKINDKPLKKGEAEQLAGAGIPEQTEEEPQTKKESEAAEKTSGQSGEEA